MFGRIRFGISLVLRKVLAFRLTLSWDKPDKPADD